MNCQQWYLVKNYLVTEMAATINTTQNSGTHAHSYPCTQKLVASTWLGDHQGIPSTPTNKFTLLSLSRSQHKNMMSRFSKDFPPYTGLFYKAPKLGQMNDLYVNRRHLVSGISIRWCPAMIAASRTSDLRPDPTCPINSACFRETRRIREILTRCEIVTSHKTRSSGLVGASWL